MHYPDFKQEKKLWKQGFDLVAGLDEVGRGPLAGPVVAAAFAVNQDAFSTLKKLKLQDSKKLSAKQREFFYEQLTTHPGAQFSVGIVSENVIDSINILEATKMAMQQALMGIKMPADFLLLDGNFPLNVKVSQHSIIKGDQKVFSIAAASIIAKVTRDRIMQQMHTVYPQYGFDAHKGYGTRAHVANLKKYGATKIHRKSFWPVKKHVIDSI